MNWVVVRVMLYMCTFFSICSTVDAENAHYFEILFNIKTGTPAIQTVSPVLQTDSIILDLKMIRHGNSGDWFLISGVSSSTSVDLIHRLKSIKNIMTVEPNYEISAAFAPDDPYYSEGMQWSLGNASPLFWPSSASSSGINAEEAWDTEQGSSSVIVAILDSGIDCDHPDLTGKCVPGYDFYNMDSDPSDDNGHGTLVAGITVAQGNDSIGVTGIAFGCSTMPVKVLNSSLSGTVATAAQGIDFAVLNGAHIINCSFVTPADSSLLAAAVSNAIESGVLVVAASGNNAQPISLYPAAYPYVLSVGASDLEGSLANFSNYGTDLDVCAPGVNIFNTIFRDSGSNNSYSGASGTSFACPHVAGTAALLKSAHPSWTHAFIASQITHTGQSMTLPDGRSTSRLDAGAALNSTSSPDLTIEPPSIFLIIDNDGDGFFDPMDTALFLFHITNNWRDTVNAEVSIDFLGAPFNDLTGLQTIGALAFGASTDVSFLIEAIDSSLHGEEYSSILYFEDIPSLYAISRPFEIELGGYELHTEALYGILGPTSAYPARKYRVEGVPFVPEGSMLMIEPEVTLEFTTSTSLSVLGTLEIIGTQEGSVRFKSFEEQLWNGIIIEPVSTDNYLSFCEFSGADIGFQTFGSGMSQGQLSKCYIHNNNYGVVMQNATDFEILESNIYWNAFENVRFDTITTAMPPAVPPRITNSNLIAADDIQYNVRIDCASPMDAISPIVQGCNLWGASIGTGYDAYTTSPYSFLMNINMPMNYWGSYTTTQLPGNASLIWDHLDNPSLSLINVTGFQAIASPDAPPVLVSAQLTPPGILSMRDQVDVLLTFNRAMDSIRFPVVTCGNSPPYNTVEITGFWTGFPSSMQWMGSFRIDERFAGGPPEYRLSVSEAYEYNTSDVERTIVPSTDFGFLLVPSIEGVHTMTVIGKINSIDVSWDDELKRDSKAIYSGHIVYWGLQSGYYTHQRIVPSPANSASLLVPDDISAGEMTFIALRYYESNTSQYPPFEYESDIEVEGSGETLVTAQVPATGIAGILMMLLFIGCWIRKRF